MQKSAIRLQTATFHILIAINFRFFNGINKSDLYILHSVSIRFYKTHKIKTKIHSVQACFRYNKHCVAFKKLSTLQTLTNIALSRFG